MILAYIDPGMGALLWQTVIAGVVGFLFYLKKTRRWLVAMFRKIFGRGGNKPDVGFKIPPSKEEPKN
jgi:hypothetical protein